MGAYPKSLKVFCCFFCLCFLEVGMFADALEAAGQVEGLTLSTSQTLPDPDDDVELGNETKRRGRYRHSLQILKPFRITHK